MNKIKKISLLGTLIVGSSLAVALPLVSCSSDSKVKEPQPIKKIINAVLNEANWFSHIQRMIDVYSLEYFEINFAEVKKEVNNKERQYLWFESGVFYKNYHIDFFSKDKTNWKDPKNYWFEIEVLDKDTYLKIDGLEFKKAKLIVNYDFDIFHHTITLEKIN